MAHTCLMLNAFDMNNNRMKVWINIFELIFEKSLKLGLSRLITVLNALTVNLFMNKNGF